MGDQLEIGLDIINTGVGGWGLTQQIRRFYEFGQIYKPRIVLLQFCSNDPLDNMVDRVTLIKDGRFVFQRTNRCSNFFLDYIASSYLIQNSHIYRLLLNFYSRLGSKNKIDPRLSFNDNKRTNLRKTFPEEDYYNNLLELFAVDLNRRGIVLLMISVNGHLDKWPNIKKKVFELDSKGMLCYYEVTNWLESEKDYRSPEGHRWGKEAHRIIGMRLSQIVRFHMGGNILNSYEMLDKNNHINDIDHGP